jgi:hypothetical protein
MSRSNPTEGSRNPSTRWFEWAGGSDGGFVRWYDKETKENVSIEGQFTFLFLDELSTVKGWHEPSESGIFANEVRDTRQDALVVRSFKGGELASGIYTSIRDRVVAVGGHYVASLYIGYKDGDELRIGNLSLKGAAAGAWMNFKRDVGTKKDVNGKSVRAYLVDAVKITGYEQLKKGGTVYRVPKFGLVSTSEATNQQAVDLDSQLQLFLVDYLKRPKAEAAPPKEPNGDHRDPPDPDPTNGAGFDRLDDDIPF